MSRRLHLSSGISSSLDSRHFRFIYHRCEIYESLKLSRLDFIVDALIPAWIIRNHALALNCKWFQEYSGSIVYCLNFICVIFHAFLTFGPSGVGGHSTPRTNKRIIYTLVYYNWIIGVKGKKSFPIHSQLTPFQMIFISIGSTFFVAQFFIFIIISSPDYSSSIKWGTIYTSGEIWTEWSRKGNCEGKMSHRNWNKYEMIFLWASIGIEK